MNPFDQRLEKDQVYNLSSGTPVNKDIADGIFQVLPSGKLAHETFFNERLESAEAKFHDPIKRNKLTLFLDSGKKAQLKAHGKVKTIEANRDV